MESGSICRWIEKYLSKCQIIIESIKTACYFYQKNHRENGETTQVDLTYYIEILSKTDETISFKLYKEGKEIALHDNKTENMKMPKGEMQEDYYKLEIVYDKTKSKSIEDILQDVQIKVHSEQMKV